MYCLESSVAKNNCGSEMSREHRKMFSVLENVCSVISESNSQLNTRYFEFALIVINRYM